MLMEKARQEIIEYGKKRVTSNLTKGAGGNLSVFDEKVDT
jgi:L-fuculose-phosphate aldolase